MTQKKRVAWSWKASAGRPQPLSLGVSIDREKRKTGRACAARSADALARGSYLSSNTRAVVCATNNLGDAFQQPYCGEPYWSSV
jgi:hypothetical protein